MGIGLSPAHQLIVVIIFAIVGALIFRRMAKRKRGGVAREQPSNSNADELSKLYKLRKAEAITDQEFEVEKKKVLGRVA